MNVHFGTYVFPKRFTSVYFLILCSPSVADPGFPKVCANLSFCKIIAENYTLWHRISFCRSAIGLPPAGQKLNNRIFSKLFGALFYEAFLQASRVVVVFIKSWKSPFAISFIECWHVLLYWCSNPINIYGAINMHELQHVENVSLLFSYGYLNV